MHVPTKYETMRAAGALPADESGSRMAEEQEPLKQAVWELAEWLDRWRETEGLEALVDEIRGAWLEYVVENFEVARPNADGKLADVIPLPRRED
jgi:hypothetical protein